MTTRALIKQLRAGPLAGLRGFLQMWRKILTDSDFGAGCPVLAASVENLPDDGTAPRDAAAAAFGNWTSILAQSLRDHGATEVDAHRTAVLVVAAAEGSVAMCRAQRSTEPLDNVAAQLESLVAAHLPQR